MAYFRDQMWPILFASLLTVLLMRVVYIVMGMVDKLVITPLRIKRIMNRQGVKGPSGYWVLGNILEMVKIRQAEANKDMKTGDYNIMSHVQPYEAQNCQAYGKMHMWWLGWQATIRIANLDLIKQVLAKDVFTMPQIQFKFLSELIGKGLVTTNGEEWALHRQIVNPAFHQGKLKVRYCKYYNDYLEIIFNSIFKYSIVNILYI
jgi:cytokinin trans-hydroxylase